MNDKNEIIDDTNTGKEKEYKNNNKLNNNINRTPPQKTKK